MKIFNQSNYVAGVQSQRPSAAPQSGARNAEAGARSVNVALSGASQSLIDAGHDVDSVRVADIKAALKSGTLQINPDRIAKGLIDSALELLD